MQTMNKKELLAFIQSGTRTGKLATIRKDGRPHVAPIWFIVEEGELIFTTMNNNVKANNMKREPRVSISIDDQSFPYSFAIIEGHAHLSHLPVGELLLWTTAIARRYVGEEQAAAFGKRNAVPEELLVRITPEKIFGSKDVAL
jgi:PPOX class probable F420-dependent enzyme